MNDLPPLPSVHSLPVAGIHSPFPTDLYNPLPSLLTHVVQVPGYGDCPVTGLAPRHALSRSAEAIYGYAPADIFPPTLPPVYYKPEVSVIAASLLPIPDPPTAGESAFWSPPTTTGQTSPDDRPADNDPRPWVDRKGVAFIEEVGEWKLGQILGRGGYGMVRLATRSDGKRAACKIIPGIDDEDCPMATKREQRIARQSRMEVLVLKAVTAMQFPGFVHLDTITNDQDITFLFLTLGESDMHGIRFDVATERDQLAFVFRRIAIALHQLHAIGMAHEDLKPSNILLDAEGAPMIADFGFAEWSPWRSLTHLNGGTPRYTSPEKAKCQLDKFPSHTPYDSKISDIWSLGIILLELIGVKHPWTLANDSSFDIETRLKSDVTWYFPPWAHKNGLSDLIPKLLAHDPKNRITIPELLRHRFLRCSKPDPPFFSGTDRLTDPMPYIPPETMQDLTFLRDMINAASRWRPVIDPMRGRQLRNCLPTWEQSWAGMLLAWEGEYDHRRRQVPINDHSATTRWVPPTLQGDVLQCQWIDPARSPPPRRILGLYNTQITYEKPALPRPEDDPVVSSVCIPGWTPPAAIPPTAAAFTPPTEGQDSSRIIFRIAHGGITVKRPARIDPADENRPIVRHHHDEQIRGDDDDDDEYDDDGSRRRKIPARRLPAPE